MEQNLMYLFFIVIFFSVAAVIWALFRLFFPGRLSKGRLTGAQGGGLPQQWVPRIAELMGPAARLTLPKDDWMKSRVRRRLMNAGYRRDEAPVIYFGAKTILAVLLPLMLFLVSVVHAPEQMNILLVLMAALGYYAPNVFLIWKIRERKREIFNAFPEALDLMVVCVESGLALDAAIAKVGNEIGQSNAALGEEFKLANLELRAGIGREPALRNLALRTGVDDIDSLVAMLIQSDKFGTSVAESLRVHADGMRSKRMLRAEEAAQKLPVKLIFPVVLLVFPSLFLVLLGPSILTLVRLLGPIMAGQ